jgi:phosphopantothenoylcysteine synthetase/decarboxylase
VSQPGIGFDSDRNAGAMLIRAADGERQVVIPEGSKREMARRILDEIVALRFGPEAADTFKVRMS